MIADTKIVPYKGRLRVAFFLALPRFNWVKKESVGGQDDLRDRAPSEPSFRIEKYPRILFRVPIAHSNKRRPKRRYPLMSDYISISTDSKIPSSIR